MVEAPTAINVYAATLEEAGQRTPEVSTDDVRRALADGSAVIVDSRKPSEYASGHIAGAINGPAAAGLSPAAYASAMAELVGSRDQPLIIYCNGQYCKAGRRLSAELVDEGFADVRRYQLGIPVWRALGGLVEIELEGIKRIFGVDQTARFFDARSPEEFAAGTLTGAFNVPAAAAESDGLDDAPMPEDDFNTRIVIFGGDNDEARRLADAMGRSPFQNVSYFSGSFGELSRSLPAG